MELFGISFELGVSAVRKLLRARAPYMESSGTSGLRAALEDVNAQVPSGSQRHRQRDLRQPVGSPPAVTDVVLG